MVLIENQLETTDHTHLGQLLTYASGLEAATIIWIAAQFHEQHQAALDWWNTKTDQSIRFFGLEIELWQIGGSLVAPNFNIVSKPNEWSRLGTHAGRILGNEALTKNKFLQLSYWTDFNKFLDTQKGQLMSRSARSEATMTYRIGRSDISLRASILSARKKLRCSLYTQGKNSLLWWVLLHGEKEEIERELGRLLELELGGLLEWDAASRRSTETISLYRNDVDFLDRASWPEQHEWLAKHLSAMHTVFAARVNDPDFIKRVNDLKDITSS